jgi:hypothetical protein
MRRVLNVSEDEPAAETPLEGRKRRQKTNALTTTARTATQLLKIRTSAATVPNAAISTPKSNAPTTMTMGKRRGWRIAMAEESLLDRKLM